MPGDQRKRIAVNEAARVLRDQGDRDYVCARHLYSLGFADQFMWQGRQALEKYLKAIILFQSLLPHEGGAEIPPLFGKRRRGKKAYGHDIPRLVRDVMKIEPWRPELSELIEKQIHHFHIMGLNHYSDRRAFRIGDELPVLDEVIWNVRRWCRHSLHAPPAHFPKSIQIDDWVKSERDYMLRMTPGDGQHVGGLLERMLDGRRNVLMRPKRRALIRWNQWFYKTRPSPASPPRWGSSSVPVWARNWARDSEVTLLLSELGLRPPTWFA